MYDDHTPAEPRKSRVSVPAISIFPLYGWRIFPVNSTKDDGECTCGRIDCPNKGKHPRIREWPENATVDPIQLAKWQKQWPDTNWAMACGRESGVWVLDVDAGNGGYESLAKLEEKIGKLPDTVRVKTGGGGLHIYFAWPTGDTVISNAVNMRGDYPGLDIRGQRGYVVVPPARHKSGNLYEWVEGYEPNNMSLSQAPAALIEIIRTAGGTRVADKPRDPRPWKALPDEVIRERLPVMCARIRYYITPDGASAATYEDWIALASWVHALTENDDDSIFQAWSAADERRYNQYDTGRKWLETADMAPRSCHRAQADHPLSECANCPLYYRDKNPALMLREGYGRELGLDRPFGAPEPTPEELAEWRQRRKEEESKEPWYAAEMAASSESTAPIIDVTEDEEEGGDYTGAGGYSGGTISDDPFRPRMAVDNITPLLELSKELEAKLRDGTDPADLKHEVIDTLYRIKKIDPDRYDTELARLIAAEKEGAKKNKRSSTYNKKTLEAGVQSMFEREHIDILTRQYLVGEVWPDAPEEHLSIPLPAGYKYGEDGVQKLDRISQGGVANFEAISSQPTYISGWREDISTGEITVVIQTQTRHRGWIEVTAQPSTLEDKRKTSELRDQGCGFQDSVSFGKYLLAGYDLVRTRFGLEPELESTRLGWHIVHDDLYFVFPEVSYGTKNISLQVNKTQLMQDLSVRGDVEEEGEALVGAMLAYPKLAFAIGTAAASILMRPAKLRGISDMFGFCTEYVSAQTGTGKSTTASAAISIYGSPHSVRNFQMTQFAATQNMIVRSDLPNVWQEAQAGNQAGKGNNADPGMLLHILGDGGGKLMGTKGGGLRHNPQIFGTMLLANNENFVNVSTAKQGELQRVFSFEPPFPPNDPSVKKVLETLMRTLSDNHGNGGRAMVQKLIELAEGSWSKLCTMIEQDYGEQYEAARKLIPSNIENHSMFDRRAKNVALVRVALKYLIEYGYNLPDNVTEALYRGVDEAFRELIEDETSHSDDKVLWRRAIRMLRAALSREPHRVAGWGADADKTPMGGWIGGIKQVGGIDCIVCNRDFLDSFLAEKGMQPIVLYKAWKKEDVTMCQEGRNDYSVRADWGNKMVDRYICIKLEKIMLQGGDEPDQSDVI